MKTIKDHLQDFANAAYLSNEVERMTPVYLDDYLLLQEDGQHAVKSAVSYSVTIPLGANVLENCDTLRLVRSYNNGYSLSLFRSGPLMGLVFSCFDAKEPIRVANVTIYPALDHMAPFIKSKLLQITRRLITPSIPNYD